MFAETLACLIIQNDDRFRIRAYDTAIDIFSNLPEPLEKYWRQDVLTTIPGVGPFFAQKIEELFSTGKIREFEEIKAPYPAGMFALLPIEGIGPKIAYKLAKTFKLTAKDTAISQLLTVLKGGLVRELEGFGQKSEDRLIESIELYLKSGKDERIPLYRADQIVAEITLFLEGLKEIKEFSPLGSLRRRKETVGDIDIGIATDEPEKISKKLLKLPKITRVLSQGKGMVRVIYGEGIDIDFKIVDPKEWGSLLQHFTGSKEHNVAMREMAVKRGMSMSEHGMKIDGEWQRFTDEKSFYKSLGLDLIDPEIRENKGEIEASLKHKLPKLITLSDLKGDLHTHTNYGWVNSHDAGMSSIDELADQAIELGYEYLGVGDHNPSVSSYNQAELVRQVQRRSDYIEQINSSYEKRVKKSTIKLFKTLEIDIRPNGTLALPDEATQFLDYTVVSIHSSFKLSIDDQTARIIKALSFPKVRVFGHPTARLIGKREQIKADWDKIMQVAKEKQIALEINSSGDRLDLPAELVRMGGRMGVLFAINTDAHAHFHLKNAQSGVDVARRGWVTAKEVVNSWNLGKFEKWIQSQ